MKRWQEPFERHDLQSLFKRGLGRDSATHFVERFTGRPARWVHAFFDGITAGRHHPQTLCRTDGSHAAGNRCGYSRRCIEVGAVARWGLVSASVRPAADLEDRIGKGSDSVAGRHDQCPLVCCLRNRLRQSVTVIPIDSIAAWPDLRNGRGMG